MMNMRATLRRFLGMCGRPTLNAIQGRLDELGRQLSDMRRKLHTQLEKPGHSDHSEVVFGEMTQQTVVETGDYELINPEAGLGEFLYSFLPTRKAIDVGANIGEVSERLLDAGYEVYAFEPFQPVFEKLLIRLGCRRGFHAFCLAIARQEGEVPLHVAEDRSGSSEYD